MALAENLRRARDFAWYLRGVPVSARPQVFRMKGGTIRAARGSNTATLFGISASSNLGERSAISEWKAAVGRAVRAEVEA